MIPARIITRWSSWPTARCWRASVASATNPGFLVELDPTTAAPTLIGQTVPYGYNNLTALESLPATDDYYSISVNAGDSLVITTSTPGDGAGEFVNTLDPAIELIDPNGDSVGSDDDGAADGRNAQLSYTALLSGTYLVRVSGAKQTQGEYVLTVSGFTGALSPSAPLAASPVASVSAAAAAAIAPVPGDVNFDGVFDSADLVQVFQIGKYEDGIDNNSSYDEGDWNGDGDFDSKDLVEVVPEWPLRGTDHFPGRTRPVQPGRLWA